MAAEFFMHDVQKTKDVDTADKAFKHAREEAFWDHGHAGYTGTIAEKDTFVVTPDFDTEEAMYDCPLTDDKWGPAGCIEHEKGWIFFGWASS